MIGMDAKSGTAMTGRDHLQQSIADILMTPLGTRVMRREYGSLIPELIDQPLNGATILRLYAATAYALMQWEPRIRLSSVALNFDKQGASMLDLDGIAGGENLQLSIPVKNA